MSLKARMLTATSFVKLMLVQWTTKSTKQQPACVFLSSNEKKFVYLRCLRTVKLQKSSVFVSNRCVAFPWRHRFYIYAWPRQSRDVDSVRTAKDRERGEVREGRWRRIQWSGLAGWGFPNPSMRPYGELGQKKSRLSAFCLLSNLTRQGGSSKRKGAKVSGGWDGMGCWCRDTDGVEGGHVVDFILYFSSAPLFQAPLPPHTNLFYTHRHTHIQKHTYRAIFWNPQREVIRGCPLHTHPSTPHPSLILLCHRFVRVSNKTDGQEKKIGRKKTGGKKRVSISLQSSTWATFID